MHSESKGYKYLPDPLPKVKILCYDQHGEEEIMVIGDCLDPDGPLWNIDAICAACEDAYLKWVAKR
tara:strand:+ start:313 stop:510 length:198 start_codon:yes stop_codon:yes gene_type:complete